MMQAPHPLLWEAFRDGVRFQMDSGPVAMQCHDLGALILPTGQILACDPVFDFYTEPFDRRVAPGRYPIFFATREHEGQVALAMVQFRRTKPVSWVASEPSQFGVDAAMAAILDLKTGRRIRRALESDRSGPVFKQISDACSLGGWANLAIDPDSGANLILFPPLGGDATFSCYWGLTATGRTACLVLDCFFWENVIGLA
jgi:Protein of unknown function (DUF4241)